VTIRAAQVPTKPNAPTTTWSSSTNIVTISWVKPNDGGRPITGYSVQVLKSDGVTYTAPVGYCNTASSTATTCTIPANALRSTPFSLNWGTSVFAKVAAINSLGYSQYSDAGNGAVIITSPDPPTNLSENFAQKTKTQIGITWSPPPFNGGSTIQSYRLYMAIEGQSFSIIDSAVTTTSYLISGLTTGTKY